MAREIIIYRTNFPLMFLPATDVTALLVVEIFLLSGSAKVTRCRK